MEYIFYFFTVIFGAIIGSFLNVVIYRYNTGITILGRSFCFSCNKQLTWKELFPVFSFLALRGKCHFCKSKISKQYTIVEVIMGVLSSLIFWKMGGFENFISNISSENLNTVWFLYIAVCIIVFGLLLCIGVYDFKHKIIPDFWAYSFAAIALLRIIFMPETFSVAPSMWDFFAGPLLAAPFAILWLVSGGRWMGLGDAKLTLGLGWFLGIKAGLIAIVLAFWIGAIVGILIILAGKLSQYTVLRHRITLKSEIPFAPFLLVGIFLVFFIPSFTNIITLWMY